MSAPLEVLPIYLRGGSIIPLGPRARHSGEQRLDPLRLLIPEPGGAGGYTVRDPDGDIHVAYTTDGDRLAVDVTGAPGEVSVEVPGRSAREEERPSPNGHGGGRRRLLVRVQPERSS